MSRERIGRLENAAPAASGRPVRVLLVDDQAPFRAAARTVIELTDGFALVGESHTGEDAVTAALSLRPDLILMDVNLPGIDGTEASRRILAAAPPGREPIVVLISTYEAADYAPRARACGAVAYVPKSELDCENLVRVWRLAGRDTAMSERDAP